MLRIIEFSLIKRIINLTDCSFNPNPAKFLQEYCKFNFVVQNLTTLKFLPDLTRVTFFNRVN